MSDEQSWADKMMDEFDHYLWMFMKVFAVLLVGIMLGYAWRMAQTPGGGHDVPDRQQITSVQEKAEFTALLAHHGLQYEVSIVYEDHLGKYFIRGGKRCPFIWTNISHAKKCTRRGCR